VASEDLGPFGVCTICRAARGADRPPLACLKNRGMIAPLNVDSTAEALIIMSEAVLNEKLGNGARRDWRPYVDAVAAIWERTIYAT